MLYNVCSTANYFYLRRNKSIIKIKVVTASADKLGDRELTIAYGFHETPFGPALIALSDHGICHFSFTSTQTKRKALKDLQEDWPHAVLIEDNQKTATLIKRVFSKQSANAKPLSLWLRGTDFQIKVWKSLLKIPAGQVSSYGAIAKAIGKPKATRAVGTAIGANPVGFIIPCHRVIRKDGGIGGYRWGVSRKRKMLINEEAI